MTMTVSDHSMTMKTFVLTATFALWPAAMPAADEPQVKTLVLGMLIQRLPVTLTNIDSVDYGPDGRLYAAGYDGRVHVPTDTDGDDIEDKVDV